MIHVVIVTGGNRDHIHYRKMMKSIPHPYVIGCDAGALWLLEQGEQIDLAVGDFDTIGNDGLARLARVHTQIMQVQAEKDETDTELALLYAIEKKPAHITIYGGLGSRFDHTLANVHLLWKCHKLGIHAKIVDPWNEIQLMDQSLRLKKTHTYVSLIPYTPVVQGITLRGFKYPLINATLEWGNSIGISNEIVGHEGEIEVASGVLMVIESSDQIL